jgi:glycerol-1-phosphate dehydrogenase [NAD(P)+]
MIITDMLSQEIVNTFKKRLDTAPKLFFYRKDAAEQLANALRNEIEGDKVLMLADIRTRAIAGDDCLKALTSAGWQVNEFIIPDNEDGNSPVCDDFTKNKLQQELPEADAYVAVGSGVVNDLTKWLSAEAGTPYAVYATAASMNGYAAANVAPMIDGVKALFRAQSPLIIAADPEIVVNAPFHLTASGLGDVIAKPVSSCDWLINNMLFQEDYSELVANIINQVEPAYLEHTAELAQRNPAAVKGLFKALVLSGCAMTLQGSSMPASGGEHLISHTLDIKANIEGGTHDLHGRQVGVCTIFAGALYQRILEIEQPRLNHNPLIFDAGYWGNIADVVEKQYIGACGKIAAAASILSNNNAWQQMKVLISSKHRGPASIKKCLKSAGAAHQLEDIGCSRQQFHQAVINSACMRERFTSMDLAFMLGILPGAIDEIIDEWL